MKIEGIVSRIEELMAYCHLSKTAFALRCGLNTSNFTRMMSNNQTITVRTVEKISSAFPEINREWLLNGTGTMLKASPFIQQAGDNNTAVGHNSTVNNSDALILAINELSAQRRVTEKAQEQIDRLLKLLEQK